MSEYYSGNCDGQLSVMAVKIDIVIWNGNCFRGALSESCKLCLYIMYFICCCFVSMTVCMYTSKAEY